MSYTILSNKYLSKDTRSIDLKKGKLAALNERDDSCTLVAMIAEAAAAKLMYFALETNGFLSTRHTCMNLSKICMVVSLASGVACDCAMIVLIHCTAYMVRCKIV